MANFTWPVDLPDYLDASGFSEEDQPNVISQSMDGGPPQTRRRDAARISIIKGSIRLTKAQYDTLMAFHRDTLKDGANTFDWVHPITQTSVEYRFNKPPQVSAIGPTYYKAQLELEVQP